ncbi:hypothetical protein O3P69_010418 [Scylla paramamosain]|uniref:EF-hand domain-containing protein n=1 Tax=Scylla paramamosain TaxID=85552 RepID=A0AAW0TT66_SCYPA
MSRQPAPLAASLPGGVTQLSSGAPEPPTTPRRMRRRGERRRGDGTFSFNEFVEIVCNMGGGGERPAEDEEKEMRDAFKIFDKHERGYICASDLRAVLQCLGEDLSEEEIEDMIREVDIDGDGRIDFEEFVKALGENDDSDDEEEARDEDDDEERK